jgi:hypothetical protein
VVLVRMSIAQGLVLVLLVVLRAEPGVLRATSAGGVSVLRDQVEVPVQCTAPVAGTVIRVITGAARAVPTTISVGRG